MNYDLFDSHDTDLSLQNKLLMPPIFLKNKIYFLSNPKVFFILYKIGKLSDFITFTEICGYDEIKRWFKSQNLLEEAFLENVSLYSVFCKVKHPQRMRFFVKNPVGNIGKFDLN